MSEYIEIYNNLYDENGSFLGRGHLYTTALKEVDSGDSTIVNLDAETDAAALKYAEDGWVSGEMRHAGECIHMYDDDGNDPAIWRSHRNDLRAYKDAPGYPGNGNRPVRPE
jgi:hypothetical protein